MTTKTGVTASGSVVLMSGGLDSTAALHHMVQTRPKGQVRALGLMWGQPNADNELTIAGHIAKRLGVPYKLIHCGDIFATDRPDGLLRGVPDHDPEPQGIHKAFVTGRNPEFLCIAARQACAWFPTGNVEVVMGCNKDDRMFPDCDSRKLERYVDSLRPLFAREIRLVLPFCDWTKEQIVAFATAEAREDIARSWSCYRKDGPCGLCTPCVLRAAAFAAHGLADQCAHARMHGGDPARDAAFGSAIPVYPGR
jgi:7-cyano-7-deazaguanine synthase in queuosine biosynthesis